MSEEIKNLTEAFKDFRKEYREDHQLMRDRYVSKDRFLPVEKIAYGLVTLILTAVVIAIIAGVVSASP